MNTIQSAHPPLADSVSTPNSKFNKFNNRNKSNNVDRSKSRTIPPAAVNTTQSAHPPLAYSAAAEDSHPKPSTSLKCPKAQPLNPTNGNTGRKNATNLETTIRTLEAHSYGDFCIGDNALKTQKNKNNKQSATANNNYFLEKRREPNKKK